MMKVSLHPLKFSLVAERATRLKNDVPKRIVGFCGSCVRLGAIGVVQACRQVVGLATVMDVVAMRRTNSSCYKHKTTIIMSTPRMVGRVYIRTSNLISRPTNPARWVTLAGRSSNLSSSIRVSELSFPARHPVRAYSAAVTAEETAKDLSQLSVDELASGEEEKRELKENQHKRPWHREGVDHAPVRRERSAGAMTKGEMVRLSCR